MYLERENGKGSSTEIEGKKNKQRAGTWDKRVNAVFQLVDSRLWFVVPAVVKIRRGSMKKQVRKRAMAHASPLIVRVGWRLRSI